MTEQVPWAINGVATHKCPLRFRRPDGGVDWRKVRAEDEAKQRAWLEAHR